MAHDTRARSMSDVSVLHVGFRRLLSALFGGLLAMAALSVPVQATTPDNQTPANENVCNSVKGGTPGLYGLCVAYCEAQDLDIVGDKETPSNKILAKYRAKMQAGDPDMPCVKVPCPCWTEADLARITGSGGSLSCGQTTTTALIRNSSPIQLASIDKSLATCRFTDTSVLPPVSRRFSAIEPAAGDSCYAQVVQACANLGR